MHKYVHVCIYVYITSRYVLNIFCERVWYHAYVRCDVRKPECMILWYALGVLIAMSYADHICMKTSHNSVSMSWLDTYRNQKSRSWLCWDDCSVHCYDHRAQWTWTSCCIVWACTGDWSLYSCMYICVSVRMCVYLHTNRQKIADVHQHTHIFTSWSNLHKWMCHKMLAQHTCLQSCRNMFSYPTPKIKLSLPVCMCVCVHACMYVYPRTNWCMWARL